MAKVREQNVEDLDVLLGLDGIRAKPGMYVTHLGKEGVFQLMKEAMDNVRDEYAAGRCDYLYVTHEDGEYCVCDTGGGMPVGIHKKVKLPAVEMIVSMTHAGGKLHKEKSKAFSGSVGTFGVGIKACNALAKKFSVTTFRNGKWHHIEFKKGKKTKDLHTLKGKSINVNGKMFKKGTIIRFKPDKSILGDNQIIKEDLKNWAIVTSYLNPKFKIEIKLGGLEDTYVSKKGLEDFSRNIAETKFKGLHKGGKVMNYEGNINAFSLVFAVGCEGEQIQCYTNTSPNVDGGEHSAMVIDNMYECLKQNYSKKSDKFLKPDVTDGLTGIINATLDSPDFSSQTKSFLSDVRPWDEEDEVWDFFNKFFKKNKKYAKQLVARAVAIRESKDQFRDNKKLASLLKGKRGKQDTPSSLAKADKKTKPEDIELFIVEGESAGGSAKKARMREFQSVLPTKGKPANITNLTLARIQTSMEIVKALQSIGVGKPKLAVGKIILLSDGDPDGKHIDALWLSVLAKMIPSIFDKGGVYTVEAPLRYAKFKGDYVYGNTTDEVLGKLPKSAPSNIKIGYIKGYGEIGHELLHQIAFNPKTRVLHKVSLKEVEKGLNLMSSSASQERLKLLMD